jgi:hypothetical protein
VDGGLWNNLPFREFEGEGLPGVFTPKNFSSKERPGSDAINKTLLLRLEYDKPARVTDFWALLRLALYRGVFGTGESQVNRRYNDQTILLDTYPLELVNFKPSIVDRTTVEKRSQRAAYKYFSKVVPEDVQDPRDEKSSEARALAAANLCAK